MATCGNPKCCSSTGICGRLTFGSGKLDDYGYWEHPCRICAADCERRTGEQAWPPDDETYESCVESPTTPGSEP